jgi:hypothetical protein
MDGWVELGAALLRGLEGCSEGPLAEAVGRLRSRPEETRWTARGALHAHPLGFHGGLFDHSCDGKLAGCVGFHECWLGFRCTEGCDWDCCLACAAQAAAASE